jgi:hypothetical protein
MYMFIEICKRNFVRKPVGKKSRERNGSRWKENVKWILRIYNERAWASFIWLETQKLVKTLTKFWVL